MRLRTSNGARPKAKAARRAGVVHAVNACGEGPLDARLALSPARTDSFFRLTQAALAKVATAARATGSVRATNGRARARYSERTATPRHVVKALRPSERHVTPRSAHRGGSHAMAPSRAAKLERITSNLHSTGADANSLQVFVVFGGLVA